MESKSIISAWSGDLQEVLGNQPLTIEDVRVGVFYTAVQIAEGHVGVAFTPRGLTDSVCCPQSAADAPPAGRMAGRNAWELAEYAQSTVSLRRAVGVATLNALSALALTRREMRDVCLLPGADALDAAEVQPDDRVALVGAFIPFIKALRGHVADLWIIDKHPEALKPDEKHFWRPPEQALRVLADASVVIMTGSTLVEGGTDDLLDTAQGARRVVMAGPTASPWPPTFFARGVDVLGGIRVTDGPKLLQIVSEGGSGYFFGQGAEKVCSVRVAE
jgi:uncharacterized protein (DUF4213/DUF364 family)